MSYKLNDIRNLRIDWQGEFVGNHSAAIHFSSGDERFHIWLRPECPGGVTADKVYGVPFELTDTLYANLIEGARHSKTKYLDMSKAAHSKLRAFIEDAIKANVGNLNNGVYAAARDFVEAHRQAQLQHRADLASNIRASLRNIAKPSSMAHDLLQRSDDELIELRGAMYNATYPDSREYAVCGTVAI